MRSFVEVPVHAVNSEAKFVVLDDDLSIVSEHGDSQSACRGFADFVIRTNQDGVIVERMSDRWVEY